MGFFIEKFCVVIIKVGVHPNFFLKVYYNFARTGNYTLKFVAPYGSKINH